MTRVEIALGATAVVLLATVVGLGMFVALNPIIYTTSESFIGWVTAGRFAIDAGPQLGIVALGCAIGILFLRAWRWRPGGREED